MKPVRLLCCLLGLITVARAADTVILLHGLGRSPLAMARLAHDLRAGLCDYQHLAMSIEARGAARHAGIRDAIENWSLAALRRHGAPVDEQQARRLLAADMELNAQGLGVWLDRQAAA